MAYVLHRGNNFVQKTTFSSLEEAHFHFIEHYKLQPEKVIESIPNKLIVFQAKHQGVSDVYRIEKTFF